jgi:hypothetical protein
MKLTVHENFAQVFADYRADTVRGGDREATRKCSSNELQVTR